jgi:hypothetical protein
MLHSSAPTNSLQSSSAKYGSSGQHDVFLSTCLKSKVAPELGVFDSPLDPSGLWNLSEQLDSHPSLSSAEQFRDTSPALERPPSRTRHDMRSPQPSLSRHRSRCSITGLSNHSAPSPDLDINRDPMQRWQDSPPEDEPAALSAIINAIQTTSERKPEDPSQPSLGTCQNPADAFRGYRNVPSSINGQSGDSKSS